MNVDELLEWIRARLRDPRQLIVYVWFAWWLWSLVRGRLQQRRQAEQAESEEQTQPDARTEPPRPPPPPPQPPPPRAPRREPSPAPQARPETAPARERLAKVARTVVDETERDGALFARALERAHVLRKRIAGDRALRRLEPIAVDEVIDPLSAAQQQAGKAHPDPEARARGGRALLTLGVLERVLSEREREFDAARLAEVDAITDACHAPLRQYAYAEDLRLRGVHPVAIRAPLPEAASTPDISDKLLLVPVPASVGANLNDYTAALHELGRRWYHGLSGLSSELQSTIGVAPRARLLEPRSSYDAASVHAYFGPWLAALFADSALTLRLGNGYVAGLRKSLGADAHVTRAPAEGAFVGRKPPGALRMRAALNALAALGQHDEAAHHRAAFAAEHEGLERSYLPLAGGRVLVVDSDYLLEVTDLVSKVVLEAPLASLGGVALSVVPGLPQSLEERREQPALARAIAERRVPQRMDAAQLLSGALLAWDAGVDPQLAIAELHGALTPRAAQAAPEKRAPRQTQAPRSLRAGFRDPRTLRSAIVLGAALERPRSQPR
jgi:hypothetical protein